MPEEAVDPPRNPFELPDELQYAILATELQSMQARAAGILGKSCSPRVCLDLLSALVTISRERTLTDAEKGVLVAICDVLQKHIPLLAEFQAVAESFCADQGNARSELCGTREELRSEIERISAMLDIDQTKLHERVAKESPKSVSS